METKIDRSFPCLVFLAERLSKPSDNLSRTSESDYVFFSPSISLKRDDPQCTLARDREKQSDALPNARTGTVQDAEHRMPVFHFGQLVRRIPALEIGDLRIIA